MVFAESLKTLQLIVTVGMDHGVVNYPQDTDNVDDLIRIADERLYQRKHAHHGRPAEGASRATEPAQTPVTPPAEKPAAVPNPISIESKRAPEKPQEAAQTPSSSGAINTPPSEPQAAAPEIMAKPSPISQVPRAFTTPRKAERVSMTGTNAYAVLGEQGARRARVLDLGFGGVALEIDSPEGLTESTLAVLHVPILPPVRVNLKPVWTQRTDVGGFRVGCTFVS
jgi:hypothetical protein